MSRRQAHNTRRRARVVSGVLPNDLYGYIDDVADTPPLPAKPASARADEPSLQNWTVSDDWPDRVPVTEAEIDLFEAWFGDIIDELFGKPG